MKSIKFSILALFIASFSFAQSKEGKVENSKPAQMVTAEVKTPATPKQSTIKWDQEIHDFGDIEKGKPVTYEFSFTNNTKETVLITNVRPACGCTAANYTKTPIKPGEKGMVAATFNAASPGMFQKSVTITTTENGSEAVKTLSFKGKVLDNTAN
ncbi:DUF1573 domain-containing protein [Flavobacterium sp. HXWNR69]|jgi:hypothetical protein|uniref:DUF1573 domain-containing protein n=1 Tax=Flavobacterium fragile TaxID=2949085 RepID=A0ABT0TFD8_9FLAO|nr:DUF1573 domain-containing protein [Flavobacterium sp. HXWNR69]MCL9769533.1 DUF1573 domain-containing protein [Flavobacterium sp. HXWNR69]